MSPVEDGDLDIHVSMALVLTGRYRDLIKIRDMVREKIGESPGARLIHGTVSSVPLYITKERPKKLGELELSGGGKIG